MGKYKTLIIAIIVANLTTLHNGSVYALQDKSKTAELFSNYIFDKIYRGLERNTHEEDDPPTAFDIFGTSLLLTNVQLDITGITDPAICYELQLTNPNSVTEPYFLSFDLPIDAPGQHSFSANLTVDLQDSNNDGKAAITSDFGALDIIQRAFLVADDVGYSPIDVGNSISSPGVHSFEMGPVSGDAITNTSELDLVLSFNLSPGDTVNLKGSVVMDLGTNAQKQTCTIGTPIPVSATDCLFDWAETSFPQLFAPTGATSNSFRSFYYRYYPGTKSYIGVSATDHHVYYLNAKGQLLDVGTLSEWLMRSHCPVS